MDDNALKNKLVSFGMKPIDANTLITIAKNKKTSISRVFFWSVSGLYWFTMLIVVTYFFFIYNMSEKEVIAFTVIYIPGLIIMHVFTPFFKKLFWSLKVLFSLRGE